MQTGCGRFGESEWSVYMLEPNAHTALAEHLSACAVCRSEAEALRRTASLLRSVPADHGTVRQTFARSVMAEYTSASRRPATTPAPSTGLMRHLQRRWSMPLAWAAGVSVFLIVATFGGWLPWTPGTKTPMTASSLGHMTDDAAPELMMASDAGVQLMMANETSTPFVMISEPPVAAAVTIPHGRTDGVVETSFVGPTDSVPLQHGHGVTQVAVALP